MDLIITKANMERIIDALGRSADSYDRESTIYTANRGKNESVDRCVREAKADRDLAMKLTKIRERHHPKDECLSSTPGPCNRCGKLHWKKVPDKPRKKAVKA